MWKALIFTLFPDEFPGPLASSLSGKALNKKLWDLSAINIRDYATNNHKTVDDTPYGGGPGMVIKPTVIESAIEANKEEFGQKKWIYLSPRGKPLSQKMVKNYSKSEGVVLLCGHYEGIDERILHHYPFEEVSIGDYVLSGGEMASFVLLDACVRLLPGVMGKVESLEEESFENNLLEYPHYTRPRIWNGYEVPEVLQNGHHAHIEKWKKEQAMKITKNRRPDLWKNYCKKLPK